MGSSLLFCGSYCLITTAYNAFSTDLYLCLAVKGLAVESVVC